MKRSGLFILMLMSFALLLLAACNPAGGSEPAAEATPAAMSTPDEVVEDEVAPAVTATAEEIGDQEATPQGTGDAAACPEADAETRLLSNAAHGYCLLYPSGHKVEKPNANETAIVVGGLLNAGDPRVHIKVEPADGRTAEAVADELANDMTIPGMTIPRSNVTIGQETAVMLDGLPGQDLNRRLIFTHDDRLYELMFMPLQEVPPAPGSQMETFYNTVVDSFTFVPPSDEVVEECLLPMTDEQAYRSQGHGYCLLLSADFQVEASSENQDTFYVGSLMDVEHPKLFIEVEDAAGRTADQAAGEIVAEFEGMGVERSFGLTLGYEVAEILDKVPGQEISRQLLVVHNDRLYKLTFIPSDPGMGDVYQQMEELYALVVNSFRFLPEA